MKKIFLLLMGAIVTASFMASYAAAMQTFSFNDVYANWPGQQFPSGWDNKDEYGSPKVEGMTVNITDDSYLSSIVINMTNRNAFINNWLIGEDDYIFPDSLFINTDTAVTTTAWKDCSWDYYVRDVNYKNDKGATLYQVKDSANGNDYYTYASGVNVSRLGHADGIKDIYLTSLTPNFSVVYSLTNNTLTYNFSQYPTILMGNAWSIGHTPECANDVILVTHKGDTPNNPVPEPATMFLLGVGLIGIAGVTRKKFSA